MHAARRLRLRFARRNGRALGGRPMLVAAVKPPARCAFSLTSYIILLDLNSVNGGIHVHSP
jgi:hypothetical protein